MPPGYAAPVDLAWAKVATRGLEHEMDCAARSNTRVLITGENGVGKRLLAQLIHQRSGSAEPFVIANGRDTRFPPVGRGTLLIEQIELLTIRTQDVLLQYIESDIAFGCQM